MKVIAAIAFSLTCQNCRTVTSLFMTSLVIALLIVCPAFSFDPSSINYCDLKCGDEENSACKCDPLDRRSEDLSDLQQFRKRILERHNDIRTRVASDREHLQFCGKASNMNVLSYDLELEYVARCYAIKYVFHHDKCRRTSKFAKPGQVIVRFPRKPQMKDIFEEVTALW